MPHVTVIDVARHAGVSKSTVSNVIRGSAVVAPATRAKVEASVRVLGYRPNGVARALRERATKVLALVVPDAVNPFYAQLAHGMERRARREGFGVLVAHTAGDPSTELAQVTALMSRRADGVLLGGLSHSSTLHLRLLDEGVPVVCGFAADDERFGVIDTDDATGMAAIVDHLAGLGHRRVAFAGQGFEEAAAELRRTAFAEAAEARDMTVVGLDEAPTAVVAHNDAVAIGELDRLHRIGLGVPRDVSVTGYDDIALASHALIGLTTVGTDAELAGEVAAEQLILAVREHRHVRHRHLQPARLVVRATTGPAPGEAEAQWVITVGEVVLSRINKQFDAVRVLEDLDLRIEDGEFVVLLGPSGCGKTTALRIVAGLERPTSGRVHIAGQDVTHRPPRGRDIAMVFQSYALYPHLTVAENIAYPLKVRKVDPRQREDAVLRVARSLEVDHLLARRPRQLSGGQRQRIALARAIIREPAAFLMDEPLSNLDAKLRTTMRAEIKRLQQRLGTTTIYVTHDQVEALTMADRVCLLKDGRVQQYAPPQDVFDRPANRFVAEFVGNPPMNVLDVALDPARAGVVLAGSPVPLGDRYRACAAAGVSQVGVRARDLELVPAATPGSVSGSVYVVEPLGDEVFVEVLLGGARASVRASRGWTAEPGSPVGVRVDPARACFFTADGTTAVHRSSVHPSGKDSPLEEVEGILS